MVAAEDTRHTVKLLNYFGISKPLVSYWGEKEKVKAAEVLRKLREGQSVALVSDAGTPGISDPGGVLIRKALDEGIDVVPVPGPSALVTALSISGLPTEIFTFIGFLPSKKNQRKKVLKDLSLESATLVFYESPHRVIDTLIDMEDAFGGERRVALIRELTKIHEEILANSEAVMGALQLPYRVANVCTGDLGRGQAKKFDIEAWMPSRKNYCETHSASKFYEFQARRMNLRYKDTKTKKNVFCHTLNNTVIASPRILIPILELYQNADGSVTIPKVLRPYMGGKKKIVKR